MARTNAVLNSAQITMISALSGVANSSVLYKNGSGVYTGLLLSTFVQTTGDQSIGGLKTFTSMVTIDNNTATKGVSVINTNNSGGVSAGYFENDTNGTGTNYVEFALSAGDSRSNRFYRNLASAITGGPVVQIWQDNSGDDQSPLRVINDGTGAGLFINNTGTGYGLIVDAGSVGIGTATPNSKAILDLTSTTLGFLPPRMTTTQKNAIGSPATGLIVFDTTLAKVCVYGGAAWQTITSV